MHRHQDRDRSDHRDGREILLGVVGQLRKGARIDDLAGRRQPQRVAVRRRLGDGRGTDRAEGADAVVDHDRLAQALGQLLGDNAADDVGAAPGGNGTTRRIGRVGNGSAACAAAADIHRRAANKGDKKSAKQAAKQGDERLPSHGEHEDVSLPPVRVGQRSKIKWGHMQ